MDRIGQNDSVDSMDIIDMIKSMCIPVMNGQCALDSINMVSNECVYARIVCYWY